MSKICFSVYLSSNNKLKRKPLFKSFKYRESLNFYKTELENNNQNVVFPLRYISNKNENRLQKYYLLFVRESDLIGQQIIKHQEYYIEEKFYVYGLKKRLSVYELFEYLIKKYGAHFTMVRIFKNKIVLECGDEIECVLTKNKNDCKRLYYFFKDFAIKKNLKAFLFLGVVPERSKQMKSELIQKLVKFTGLSHYQFKRNTTRH